MGWGFFTREWVGGMGASLFIHHTRSIMIKGLEIEVAKVEQTGENIIGKICATKYLARCFC